MNVSIVSKDENKLVGRTEIKARVDYEGATPPRSEVKKAVCEKLGVNPGLAVVVKIDGEYGMHSADVLVHVYENEERLKGIEPEYILKRNGVLGGEKSGEGEGS